jgi:DNA-binding transcriptional LysR family regulator
LTEAGDQLFQRVRPAVQELAPAIGPTRERRARPAGIVRIHCFRTAAELFLRLRDPCTLDDEVERERETGSERIGATL